MSSVELLLAVLTNKAGARRAACDAGHHPVPRRAVGVRSNDERRLALWMTLTTQNKQQQRMPKPRLPLLVAKGLTAWVGAGDCLAGLKNTGAAGLVAFALTKNFLAIVLSS